MTNIIGHSLPRIDARGKVSGETLYPGDITLPNQAHMKILFARRPHAIIKSIDTNAAEAMNGVIAVFTAKDVPINEYGLQIPDQPVLCGPGSDKPYADRVRFVGDQVALVVAESENIAAKARDLIVVDYEDLPVVTDPRESAKPDALLLHPDKDTNIVQSFRIRKGNIEAGFAAADVIIESELHTPFQEHAYLQPEAGVAYIDDDGILVVMVAGQWLKEEQEQVAHSLGLPPEKVRIIHPAIGGAFGGREDMSVQIVLGLAAIRLHERGINRPVKIIWTREESIIGHAKRHPFFFKARWGATKDGKIVAAEVDAVSDAGAYMYTSNKVPGNATLMSTGPYEIPNVKVDTRSVYTNNIPTGALRGFGAPQGAFAAEMMVSKLAEALEMDPVEFRMRNILHEGSLMSVQTPLTGRATIDKVAERCAEEAGWQQLDTGWKLVDAPVADESRPHIKRGIGFACGFKNTGFSFGYPENSWAKIEIHGDTEIEKVIVYHGAADVGQGAHTVIMQAAAEAVGATYEQVEFVGEDIGKVDGDSGSSSASRMTFMALNAVKGAGELALQKWQNEERPAIAEFKYLAPKTTPYDAETGKATPNVAYGHCAQVADLEVDTETGHIRILSMISTSDLGKAINPQQVVGQIEGGTLQTIGYALMEDFIHENGYVQTAELSTYLVPTVLDIPDNFKTVIVEYADPNGPWGARGVGEMMTVPTAPAIVAAVHDATGVWFDDFPLTPERVLRGLGKI